MRNLKLIRQSEVCSEDLKDVQRFCVDSDKKTVYFLTSNQNVLKVDLKSGDQVVEHFAQLVNCESYYTNPEDKFVSFDFIVVEQCLFVGGSKGEVIQIRFDGEVELVDYVESGIKALSWSPDQELVVVVSGTNDIILMTLDFSVIETVSLDSEQFGEGQPVNVGWGKKETQFHGKARKAELSTQKVETVEPAFQFDDQKIRVSWREDGRFFVVSYINNNGGYRQLRVLNREGVIQFTSEHVPGLEQSLFWQPSGTLIASSIRRPNKHLIAFFEKNCLSHGEFAISNSSDQFKVCEVLWNVESTILAVWLEDLPDKTSEKIISHYIQLWTVSNFHWYLKQSLNFGSYGLKLRQVQWDFISANQLNILCMDGSYLTYTWLWTTSRSKGPLETDNSIVAVINGSQVKVTPFRKSVVPPPLCVYSCNVEKSVTSVVFGPYSRSNDFLIILDDNEVLHFGEDSIDKSDKFVRLENSCANACAANVYTRNIELILPSNPKLRLPIKLMHWTWSNANELLFTYTLGKESTLCVANINWNLEKLVAEVVDFPLEGEVVQMCSSSSGIVSLIQLSNGLFLKFDHADKIICSWFSASFQNFVLHQPCIDLQLVSVDSKENILGYTGTSLYFNNIELVAYCTSVCLSDEFLLYTTSDHILHCIPKHSLGQSEMKKAIAYTEKLRNVERGSRIVTTTYDSKLIFQMPRGNLEAIYPRPLVLHELRHLLDRLKYKEAINIMRRHRIDMNLFVDNNFTSFLKNVDKFVEQIDDVNLLNLFLSYISEENVAATIYNIQSKPALKSVQINDKISKVDTICEALRISLEKLNYNKYFLSILTCHIKMTNPELEIALQKIKEKSREDQGIALDYVHRLINVDELFNIALGTYDFQLVTMVAEKTQKDPKDYLPFLNEVKKMESNYGKFTIDNHLKRYVRALEHLIACGDARFTECMSFIETHYLYSEALKLMPKASPQYRVLLEAYGDFLFKRNSYEEAGVLYRKGKIYEKALESFKLCCNWMSAFSTAHLLNYDSEALNDLGEQLVAKLKNERRFVDAAHVLETYTQNPLECIGILLEGHEWERAIMMMHRLKAFDRSESLVKSTLLNHFDHLMVTLSQCSSTFERHKNRLLNIKEEKKEKLNQLSFDDCSSVDDFSDTSSTRFSGSSVTGSTYSSTRTARNKRKQERKRVSLKEGSPFEDIAILEALTKILTQMDNLKDECHHLTKALSIFDFDNEASKLQNQLETSLRYMLSCKHDIWPPAETETSEMTLLGPLTTSSFLAAENGKRMPFKNPPPEYLIYTSAPTLRDVNWKLSYLMPFKNTKT
ncbi:hypothetical protein CHUAL_000626 [Chamberlinius hualienensis]